MPYKVVGRNVLKEEDSEWKIKQRCKSHENALAAKRLLDAKEHGWKPDKERK